MQYIAHGGDVSDPTWLKIKGFSRAGYVRTDFSIPSAQPLLSAGLKADYNPYNDGECGLNAQCGRSDTVTFWTQVKNAGYSMIWGEGVMANITNAGLDILPYGQYCGDIGGYQWDMTADNPRGRCSFGGLGMAVVPETYVQGNVMNLTSAQTVINNAFKAGAIGVGFIIGTWSGVMQSGSYWVNFINSFSPEVQAKMAVLFWTGAGYDICSFLKSGGLAEPLNTLLANFPPTDTWGGAGPITPTVDYSGIYDVIFG
jgi:hypothetical protein